MNFPKSLFGTLVPVEENTNVDRKKGNRLITVQKQAR